MNPDLLSLLFAIATAVISVVFSLGVASITWTWRIAEFKNGIQIEKIKEKSEFQDLRKEFLGLEKEVLEIKTESKNALRKARHIEAYLSRKNTEFNPKETLQHDRMDR